jgi:hypothetical protein
MEIAETLEGQTATERYTRSKEALRDTVREVYGVNYAP